MLGHVHCIPSYLYQATTAATALCTDDTIIFAVKYVAAKNVGAVDGVPAAIHHVYY